jgi:hypothetical protein
MVEALSPPACIRCARAAFAVLTTGLLDANETNWAFVVVDGVGRVNNQQVRTLARLTRHDGCRSYCGRIADGALFDPDSTERERALAVRGAQSLALRGTPTPPSGTGISEYRF